MLRIVWLSKVVLASDCKRLGPISFRCITRNGNNPSVLKPRMAPQPFADVVAIESWQTQVEQDDVRLKPFSDVYGCIPIYREIDLISFHSEQRRERVKVIEVVLHDENAPDRFPVVA